MRLSGTLSRAISTSRGFGNQLYDLAGERPSLDLPFADTKSLVDATTGAQLVTFTRASSGTFVGSDGLIQTAANAVPRFDHNPTTGESLGLLVEEQRTNLSQQSEDFSNAYWVKTDCAITANESTAPDGTLTADLWSNTGSPGIIASSSITKDATARTYTGSLWVKGGGTAFSMSIDSTTSANRGRAIFNMSSGTLTSVANEGNFTNTSGSITAYANGWYRLTVTTTTSTFTGIRLRPFFSGVNSTARIWGAQVEEGAFVTSYIPTTTATVTRSADVASIIGTAFSSWYREDEGTMFGDFLPYTTAGRIFSLNVGSTSERIVLTRGSGSGGNISVIVTDNGVSQVSSLLLGTSIPSFTNNRVAFGYKASDFAGSVNGVTPVTQGTGSLPTCTQATLGNGETVGTNQLNGTIKRLTYWPTRLNNSSLQTITQ